MSWYITDSNREQQNYDYNEVVAFLFFVFESWTKPTELL